MTGIHQTLLCGGRGELEYIGVAPAHNTGTGAITLVPPAGTQEGDLLVVSVGATVSGTNSIIVPAGWNLYHDYNYSSGGLRKKVFWKYAETADLSAITVTCSTSSNRAARVFVYRNGEVEQPSNASVIGGGYSSSVTLPGLSGASGGYSLATGIQKRDSQGTVSVDGLSNSYVASECVHVYAQRDQAAGALPSRTVSPSNMETTGVYAFVTVLIKQQT
jgi:hypothetical protein